LQQGKLPPAAPLELGEEDMAGALLCWCEILRNCPGTELLLP